MAEFREVSPEELQSAVPITPSLPKFREVQPDELKSAVPASKEPPDPSVFKKIKDRFFGEDVQDPQDLTRAGTVAFGSIGGAVLGSRLGPAGTVAGGFAGVVGGAVSPEATMEALEFFGIVPKGTREVKGLSNEELKTVIEGEILLEAATLGTLSAGRVAMRTGGRVLSGVNKKAQALSEKAAKFGINLMPVQVGEREIARGFVSVMGRFPFVGAAFRKAGKEAEDAVQNAFQTLPTRIADLVTSADVSTKIFKDAENLVRGFGAHFEREYGRLFERARELGVKARPIHAVRKAEKALADIAEATPRAGAEKIEGAVSTKVREFLESNILALKQGDDVAEQTLKQMDGLLSNIDQFISTLPPKEAKIAMEKLIQVRQAAQLDVVENLRGPEGAVSELGEQLRALDQTFSQTMSELFETATAKRFGSVKRGGLRSINIDPSTRMPVDQLARMVTKLDSPQMINELADLVSPQTFKEITANVLEDAVTSSMRSAEAGNQLFNVDAFAKRLGINARNSDRAKTVAMMLEKSGSPFNMKDLEDLVQVAQRISQVEIPNASTFLARGAVIGGARGLVNSVLPGIALAGGATAGAGVMGLLMFTGGGRLIASALANTKSARALKVVLSEETSKIAKRQASIRVGRFAIEALDDEGLDPETKARMQKIYHGLLKKAEQAESVLLGPFIGKEGAQ